MEIYRNIPRPPRCRAAGTWPPGSGAAGAFLKKNSLIKLRAGPWGPVARQRGGRPPRPPGSGAAGPGLPARATGDRGFFIFYFHFLQKIYFRFGNLQEYTRPPRCWAAGTWPPVSGTSGAFLKKISRRKLRTGPWGPAARQRGGRPWPPGGRAIGSPTLI